jgi:chromatin structure-remodeling complex subunit RSC9
LRDARLVALGRAPHPSTKGMMKPGRKCTTSDSYCFDLLLIEGFDGPNIYVRTLQGLRSNIPEEQDYALHHLVKISHERGDKYKFEAFPNLAEALIEYALDASSIFYDVKWEIDYMERSHEINILDGINGTPDILQRIQCLKRLDHPDEIETESDGHRLTKIHEAGLTIRNLALLEENASYLADLPQLRDFLSIALNLPRDPRVTELKHYALDIAEQVTRFWSMESEDPLYRSLLNQVADGSDRGAVLTALRAISRISMNLEEPNRLKGVPIPVLRNIIDWILLEDEELLNASLDFLYLFTAGPENVAILLANASHLSTPAFIVQLVRLLQYHAVDTFSKHSVHGPVASASAQEIPNVPRDLLEEFLKLDEPERSTQWLKAVFEEDSESEITQIALWQAYQARFSHYSTLSNQLLPAADFIKNVSQVFTTANAQVRVVSETNSKFIIKGIRPRHTPTNLKGKPYRRCLWTLQSHKRCGEFLLEPQDLFNHIATKHLNIPQNPEGGWELSAGQTLQAQLDCYWTGCRHFTRLQKENPTAVQVAVHVKTHLPDAPAKAAFREKHNRTIATQTTMPALDLLRSSGEGRKEAVSQRSWHSTALDERADAAGLPLTSVLILRNMARHIPKAAAILGQNDSIEYEKSDGVEDWIGTLFEPLRQKLMFVLAHNKPMATYVTDLLGWIDRNSS